MSTRSSSRADSAAPLPSHHAQRAATYRRLGYWSAGAVPDRLGELARAQPAGIALVDRGSRVTYAQLDGAVRRVAAELRASGVGKGDVVAIQLPNWKEFAYFQQAAALIGAIYLPLIPQLREWEMEYILRVSGAVALVVPASHRGFDHAAMAQALRARLPALEHLYVVGEAAPAGAVTVDSLMNREAPGTVQGESIDPDEVRALFFTSGTEANPKGVRHSYNTLAYPLRIHARDLRLGPADPIFTCSPVGHATGCVFGVELGLFLGSKVVLQDAWNPTEAIDLIARERCSLMWGATTFCSDLVNAADGSRDLSCLRLMCSGGAPIPRELVRQVRDRIGSQLVAAYGSSEGLNVTINRLDDPPERIAGCDGRFNDGIDYKTVDEDRNTLRPGEAGEIAYRGPNVCLGYLDAEQTARSFDGEGFFYSGDLGVIDRDGYLRVVGRRKEIIIRGGENISPAELENLLFRHPKVSAVAVVGFPDERLGQRVGVAVVPKPGEHVALDELTAFLSDNGVARFKFPERLDIVSELPRTPTGKIRRNVLRDALLGKDACNP